MEAVLEVTPAAPAITQDQLAKLKNEDMKQAVVERFRCSTQKPASAITARRRARSPYWRPADEEC
jgi:hypothetical protein